MIVEVKQNKTEKDFPKLMINNEGMIVLFEEKGVEMVLEKPLNNTYAVGYYSNAWNTVNFKDFDGEITIKND